MAAELVQFLLVNTQYDSIATLEADQKSMKVDIKEALANKNRLEASLSTANNKVSALGKTVAGLEKKVNKL